uniref:Putative secreted protein n=1 Tax=Psorophora albipes TaxID=869069 RepID=T1D5P6_9DIPT
MKLLVVIVTFVVTIAAAFPFADHHDGTSTLASSQWNNETITSDGTEQSFNNLTIPDAGGPLDPSWRNSSEPIIQLRPFRYPPWIRTFV